MLHFFFSSRSTVLLAGIGLMFLSLRVQAQDSLVSDFRLLNETSLVQHVDTFSARVVAASRSAKNIEELPVTIYVVTRDEILKNHYLTLTDVLKSLPGIRTSLAGSGETGETFLLRGLTGNYYTKILINNIPVKPSVVGGMPLGYQLPIRQAERIEVVYGPSAAVYGADAISGVINIITREADKGTFAQADLGLGDHGFSQINYTIGGKAGRNKNLLQYSFYGSKTEYDLMNIKSTDDDLYNPLYYFKRKGIRFTVGGKEYDPLDLNEQVLNESGISPAAFMAEYYPTNYAGSLTHPDMTADLSTGGYMLGMNLKFRGISFSYLNMYRHTHSSIGKSPLFYRYNDPNAFWGENIQSISMGYAVPLSPKFSSSTSFSSLIYRMDNNTNLVVTFLPSAQKAYQYAASDDNLFEQLFTWTPALNLELMGGFSYQLSSNLPKTNLLTQPFFAKNYNPFGKLDVRYDTVLGDFGYNPFFFHNWSVYSQLYWVIRKFRIMSGLRYDINSFYGNSLNPRLAVMTNLNNRTTLRMSVGTAYKAPPASVAFESIAYRTGTNNDSVNYLVIPNDDLKPERFTATEVSINRKFFKNIEVTGSVYYYHVREMINFNTNIPISKTKFPLAVSDSVSTKINERDAVSRLYGMQGTIRWNNIVRSIGMNGEIALTINADKSKNLPDVNDIMGNFNLTPKHFGQLKLSATPVHNLFVQIESTWMKQWMRVFIPSKKLYTKLFGNTGGYYSMDILVNYQFGTNLSGFVKVINVFYEKYSMPVSSGSDMDLLSVPQPGRNIRFGLSYALN